jgi:hypothetical protein
VLPGSLPAGSQRRAHPAAAQPPRQPRSAAAVAVVASCLAAAVAVGTLAAAGVVGRAVYRRRLKLLQKDQQRLLDKERLLGDSNFCSSASAEAAEGYWESAAAKGPSTAQRTHITGLLSAALVDPMAGASLAADMGTASSTRRGIDLMPLEALPAVLSYHQSCLSRRSQRAGGATAATRLSIFGHQHRQQQPPQRQQQQHSGGEIVPEQELSQAVAGWPSARTASAAITAAVGGGGDAATAAAAPAPGSQPWRLLDGDNEAIQPLPGQLEVREALPLNHACPCLPPWLAHTIGCSLLCPTSSAGVGSAACSHNTQ